MASPRMTLDDVLEDMRAHGMKMGKELLTECLKQEVFPFCRVVETAGSRLNYIIMRKDYNAWAEEYLYAYNE